MKLGIAAVGRGVQLRVVAASLLVAVWGISPVVVRAADLLVDHVEYVRVTGVAQEASLFFPGCDPQGTYTLTVTNGQDEAHHATAGNVSVNGSELVTAPDFAQSPAPSAITRVISGVGERNTLALSVTGPQGSVIGFRVTAEVTCPEITIDAPPPGSVINRREITVSGRVRHRTPEVGIKINGQLAHVNGNYWVANDVPLEAGGNTLEATVEDETGGTALTSQLVDCPDPGAPRVILEPDRESGLAPLEVGFSMSNQTGAPLALYRLDFESDGVIDFEGPDLAGVSHTYPGEGIHTATLVALDAEGVAYSDTFALNVHPMPPLKSRWERMKVALTVGDTAAALENFTPQEAEAQGQLFAALGSLLSQVVMGMKDIHFLDLRGRQATYRLLRDEPPDGTITYYIQFTRQPSGIWAIESF